MDNANLYSSSDIWSAAKQTHIIHIYTIWVKTEIGLQVKGEILLLYSYCTGRPPTEGGCQNAVVWRGTFASMAGLCASGVHT